MSVGYYKDGEKRTIAGTKAPYWSGTHEEFASANVPSGVMCVFTDGESEETDVSVLGISRGNGNYSPLGNIDTEIGNTDISEIGDGTITGAIASISENLAQRMPFYREVVDCNTVKQNCIYAGATAGPTFTNSPTSYGMLITFGAPDGYWIQYFLSQDWNNTTSIYARASTSTSYNSWVKKL